MYNIIYETSHQCRFNARCWLLGAGALGWPRGMVWGGRREEGSEWGTRIYLWQIHVDIWQNQYNIVKLKNKIKFKNNKKKKRKRQRSQRSNCQHLLDYWKSKRVSEKHLFLLYWLFESLWLCGSQQTGIFFNRWEYQTTLPASWEICIQVKKQQLELDMEQQTVPNRERSTSRLSVVTLLI